MNEIPMSESEEVLVDDGEDGSSPEDLEKLAAAFAKMHAFANNAGDRYQEMTQQPAYNPNRAGRRAEEKAMKTSGRAQRKLDAIAASRYHAAKNRRKKTRNG